jgi:hypothetical protein
VWQFESSIRGVEGSGGIVCCQSEEIKKLDVLLSARRLGGVELLQ